MEITEREVLIRVNQIAARHCFNAGIPAIQFALASGGAATGEVIISTVVDYPRLATDDFESWWQRLWSSY